MVLMMKLRPTLLIWSTSMAVIAGCQPPREPLMPVLDKYRVPVTSVLARATEIGKTSTSIPPATEPSINTSLPVVLVALHREDLPTAAYAYPEDLVELSAPKTHPDRVPGAKLLPECASLLASQRHLDLPNHEPFAHVARSYLEKCSQVKLLFVVRKRHQEGLAIDGDVVIFEVDSGKYVGGFPISVRSTGGTRTVTKTTDETEWKLKSRPGFTSLQQVPVKREEVVNNDAAVLHQDFCTAIENGIKSLVPGARFLD
jgi:hypothetical protein